MGYLPLRQIIMGMAPLSMNENWFASLTIGMLECWNSGIMGSGAMV